MTDDELRANAERAAAQGDPVSIIILRLLDVNAAHLDINVMLVRKNMQLKLDLAAAKERAEVAAAWRNESVVLASAEAGTPEARILEYQARLLAEMKPHKFVDIAPAPIECSGPMHVWAGGEVLCMCGKEVRPIFVEGAD